MNKKYLLIFIWTKHAEMNLKNLSRGLNPPKLFKLSAGLNLETFDTILSGTNHI